ncbi:MAG: hypothetical protein WAN97_05025 [Candidatus Acidiferrales bacterium]
MISLVWGEVAKHTLFPPQELGPRNAATEENLKNVREKMRSNLMPKKWRLDTRISEWEKSGVDSTFISSGGYWHTISSRSKTR